MTLFLFYIIGALLIGYFDPLSLGVYLTILPFQYFLMKVAWKTNNIVLALLFTYMFVTVGLGTFTLYFNRGSISNVGTNHVGNFNFAYSYLFYIYSFLFVFQVIIFFIVGKRKKVGNIKTVLNFIKSEANAFVSKRKSYSIIPILATALLFAMISIWMYHMNVGMIGLKQKSLPFHLSGILFYSRRFLFTLVLIWLFVKTKNKRLAIWILVLYAFIVGVTGSSKSLNIMILVPAAAVCFVVGYKMSGYIAIISAALIYTFVTCTRILVYDVDGEIGLAEVLQRSIIIFNEVVLQDPSYLTGIVSGLCESLYGMKNVVVAFQYNSLDIFDSISYYLGFSMGSIINDMPYELYGVTYSADKSFGVCVGYPGTMVMMARHSYVFVILEALWMSFIFSIQNNALEKVFRMREAKALKTITLILVLFSFYSMMEANTMVIVYLCTVALSVIKWKARKQTKVFKHYAPITANKYC